MGSQCPPPGGGGGEGILGSYGNISGNNFDQEDCEDILNKSSEKTVKYQKRKEPTGCMPLVD